jgi:hypothetical protein
MRSPKGRIEDDGDIERRSVQRNTVLCRQCYDGVAAPSIANPCRGR